MEAMAAMKNVTELVVHVLVMGSLAVHVLIVGVVVVNFHLEALVVDVLDERGVPVHSRDVLVVDALVEERSMLGVVVLLVEAEDAARVYFQALEVDELVEGYEYWWLIEGIILFIIETVAGLIVL